MTLGKTAIKVLFSAIYCTLFLLVSIQVAANVRLPEILGSGMVLQRDKPVNIWGWAEPNEKVAVTFKGQRYESITTQDRKWRIELPPTRAGGPYEMTVSGYNSIVLKDILFGDVYVCSGQSNMEFRMSRVEDRYADEISNSTNNRIRQFAVNSTWSFAIVDDVQSKQKWRPANPHNLMNFSAVAYFFGRALYEKHHIPVGIILSSVGGTPIESWISKEALKEFPDLLAINDSLENPIIINQIKLKDSLITVDWFQNVKTNDSGTTSSIKWQDDQTNHRAWDSIKVPGYWEDAGVKDLDGVVWYYRQFYVPENIASKNGLLLLGLIDDQDSTYLNGQKVGFTTSKYMARRYKIEPGILKPGLNTIVIRIVDMEGKGGFLNGKDYKFIIDGQSIDLSGTWYYKVGYKSLPFPRESITSFNRKPTVLYNAMIAPLLPMSIKGFIWYQGEANVAQAHQYQKLFKVMIKEWRQEWQQGDIPFLFVQLPNIGHAPSEPGESNWAELREAQAMALELPNTAMAVTYDIGEWNDIHPSNKKDVGERLFLLAENMIYNNLHADAAGLRYKSMKVVGKEIEITFNEKLLPSEKVLNQFSIAGDDKIFKWAKTKIANGKLIIWNETIAHPVAVRYAWAQNPSGANLANKDGMLASPFRTDDWRGITGGN